LTEMQFVAKLYKRNCIREAAALPNDVRLDRSRHQAHSMQRLF
jgi:hypothetical protein